MAALALPVHAATLTESDFYGELPVVLSASRLSQPVAQAPAAVTIIDQDMIRASGFRDIPDLFRLVPGFNVAYTRDNTWGVGYHGMADAFSRRMQVLIDGRSVCLPGFGQTPWAFLPLAIEDIERIEVVRGPNAAAYGANSFFGVINIITKDPLQVQGAHASAQAGGTSNSRGDWHQGRADGTDPFDPVRDLDVGSEHFQAKFGRVIDPRTEWSLQFYHIRAAVGDGFTVRNFPILPGPPPVLVDIPINVEQTQWREDVEFQMIAGLNDATRLVWGAEARWEGVDAPGYFFGSDERSGALYRLFGNVEWIPAENWVVNGGVMAEHHYYSGLDFSPRLAVNYLVSPDHTLRAAVGQAYRSPTFFEVDGDARYFSTTGLPLARFFAPAGDLQPEQVISRELGYVGHVRSMNLRIDARVFDDAVRKLVGTLDIDPTPGKLFQSANLNRAHIRGADIQLHWQPRRDLDLILNYARVNIDSNEPDIENRRPPTISRRWALTACPEVGRRALPCTRSAT